MSVRRELESACFLLSAKSGSFRRKVNSLAVAQETVITSGGRRLEARDQLERGMREARESSSTAQHEDGYSRELKDEEARESE